jgi:hypothetical protein
MSNKSNRKLRSQTIEDQASKLTDLSGDSYTASKKCGEKSDRRKVASRVNKSSSVSTSSNKSADVFLPNNQSS